jgi:hypothetical protein
LKEDLMIQGSCLCGGMRFEIDEEEILFINNCHCSWCRKVTGAAYGTFIQIPGAHFRWISGADLLSTYESSPGNHRAFCKTCGSRAPQSQNWAQHVTVPAGLLDGDPLARPVVNIYTGSKAPWHDIREEIPSFEGMPPQNFWVSIWEERQRKRGDA